MFPNAKLKLPANYMLLMKLGVKPAHRRLGVGTALMAQAKRIATELVLSNIISVLPETTCHGPDSVSPWLKRQGFGATQIIPHSFIEYGETIDGYMFDWINPGPEKIVVG